MKTILSASVMGAVMALGTGMLAAAKTSFTFNPVSETERGHIALFVGSDLALSGQAAAIDKMTDGRLSQALEDAGFKGEFGDKLALYALGPYQKINVIGAGSQTLSARDIRDLGGYTAQASDNKHGLTVIADTLKTSTPAIGAQLATGYALSNYSFDKYKDETPAPDRVVRVQSGDASASKTMFETDLRYLAEGVNFARDMGTEPGKSMYPALFGERVKDLFRGVPKARVQVMGVAEMKRYNMGALMGVGQGSIHDPKLVIVSYMGASKDEAPLALVGKGITFDTGGISLKPNSGQWLMKSDLSGAAAVAGAVYAAAQRGEDINLIGVMPMAENMPARDAIRPGDVLETMSGKTIEVMSTDAEGRLVLADAVSYTQDKYSPALLVNIATLTGSAMRALGDDYAAVITRDWDLTKDMMAIGKDTGEEVWPLPLHENHFKAIQSDIATIKSTAGNPGASIGAAVVGTFIDEDQPWVHLDIAGVDWRDSASPTSPKGHSGWGVRFMDGLVRDKSDEAKR